MIMKLWRVCRAGEQMDSNKSKRLRVSALALKAITNGYVLKIKTQEFSRYFEPLFR